MNNAGDKFHQQQVLYEAISVSIVLGMCVKRGFGVALLNKQASFVLHYTKHTYLLWFLCVFFSAFFQACTRQEIVSRRLK